MRCVTECTSPFLKGLKVGTYLFIESSVLTTPFSLQPVFGGIVKRATVSHGSGQTSLQHLSWQLNLSRVREGTPYRAQGR